jgi:hypothetical protein
MTLFMKNGTSFRVTTSESLDLHELLPVGTYSVEQNPITGEYYLDRIKDLEVSGKIYGDAPTVTARILNTFMQRPDSTGVLLSGEKGSGKTLQAKLLSIYARQNLRVPTIVVNRPYAGDGFNQFMQKIEQPVVVIFDEFEKTYPREVQEAMLTLLDGVYPSKKLFILTCNDKYRINEQMKNRPGRLFYRIEYTGMEDAFIREYAADNLEDPSTKNIDDIVSIASVFAAFNFDMLQALIEEMNRYGEDAKTANKYLNARPDSDDVELVYDLELIVDGESVDPEYVYTKQWHGNPIESDVWIDVYYGDENTQKNERGKPIGAKSAIFVADLLKEVFVENGGGPVFHFENQEGVVLRLRKRKTAPAYSVLF